MYLLAANLLPLRGLLRRCYLKVSGLSSHATSKPYFVSSYWRTPRDRIRTGSRSDEESMTALPTLPPPVSYGDQKRDPTAVIKPGSYEAD